MSAKKKTAKKKTKKMSQAHGMVEEKKFQPTSLDQVWGDTGISKYNTLDEEEYKGILKDMNKSDMQAHATRMGLVPIDILKTLEKRLLREFRVHVAKHTKPIASEGKPPEINSTVKKILEEGR